MVAAAPARGPLARRTMSTTFHHRVPRDDLGCGVVRAEPVAVGPAPEALAEALAAWRARRRDAPLDAETEQRRLRSRDMLRNGRYKPTGRGKPANEYLLRAAAGDDFPLINGPVDANNVVSLQYMVPISVWDLDLAGSDSFEVRLGAADEAYVFNPSGQTLALADLVCGCALAEGGSRPLVTPIKDGMVTKIQPGTTRVAGLIYFPLRAGGEEVLAAATAELARWLGSCGEGVDVRWATLLPGAEVSI